MRTKMLMWMKRKEFKVRETLYDVWLWIGNKMSFTKVFREE